VLAGPIGKAAGVVKPKMTVQEAVSFLAASVQIRCLALMALAQGISTNLIDVRLTLRPVWRHLSLTSTRRHCAPHGSTCSPPPWCAP
jgi:hypothetical protein